VSYLRGLSSRVYISVCTKIEKETELSAFQKDVARKQRILSNKPNKTCFTGSGVERVEKTRIPICPSLGHRRMRGGGGEKQKNKLCVQNTGIRKRSHIKTHVLTLKGQGSHRSSSTKVLLFLLLPRFLSLHHLQLTSPSLWKAHQCRAPR
jgi:hypothetical protein